MSDVQTAVPDPRRRMTRRRSQSAGVAQARDSELDALSMLTRISTLFLGLTLTLALTLALTSGLDVGCRYRQGRDGLRCRQIGWAVTPWVHLKCHCPPPARCHVRADPSPARYLRRWAGNLNWHLYSWVLVCRGSCWLAGSVNRFAMQSFAPPEPRGWYFYALQLVL